jgi:very-short-patch-repair endonuclease
VERLGREQQAGPVKVGPTGVDRRIAMLADRQHGVIATRQLVALGLRQQSISDRAAAGRLHPVHRGVYAVGHPIVSRHGRWMAAVLSCGPGAVLSHAAAGALWELLPGTPKTIDVTVPRSGRRSSDLRLHRPRSLGPDEAVVHMGIPVTSPARTLLDLAAVLTPHRLERAIDQAELQRLTDYPRLDALARAHPRRPGAKALRQVLSRHLAGTTLTRSDLESRFLAICRAHGLPTPQVNVRIGEHTVDFLFPERRLIVEIDSWKYHRTRVRFDADRRRDAIHLAAGYRTLRFTDRQLDKDEQSVARTTDGALHRHDAA